MSAYYIDPQLVAELLKGEDSYILIDARTPEEYEASHAAGAINVAIDDLPAYAQNYSEQGKSDLVITMCGSTGRGEKGEAILTENGVAGVKVMAGGLKAWKEAGLPTD